MHSFDRAWHTPSFTISVERRPIRQSAKFDRWQKICQISQIFDRRYSQVITRQCLSYSFSVASPRERLPKERSSEGWMERSGTLAEPSDNYMPPYRTQETDPFGSASSFISSATIAVSFIFRQDAFPMPRQQRECLPQSVQPSSRVLHLQVWCQPRSQPHLPDDEGQIYN